MSENQMTVEQVKEKIIKIYEVDFYPSCFAARMENIAKWIVETYAQPRPIPEHERMDLCSGVSLWK